MLAPTQPQMQKTPSLPPTNPPWLASWRKVIHATALPATAAALPATAAVVLILLLLLYWVRDRTFRAVARQS